jgi:hypothetical protein
MSIDTRYASFDTKAAQLGRHRAEWILDILRDDLDSSLKQALDIGDRSPLGDQIAKQFDLELVNTTHDLDVEKIIGRYPCVFCLDVIEHLGSPLRLLQHIHAALHDGGVLYLSTPMVKNAFCPNGFLRGQHHVFEMDRRQLEFIIAKAGFRIEWAKTNSQSEFWRHLTGIRPLLRLLTMQTVLLKLVRDSA